MTGTDKRPVPCSLARREAMRKAFGALKANAAIMRLAKDNSERREIFAQLYSRFNETKCAARGFCSQAQDLQSELDELRSQNAFLVEKMAPLKSLVTHYKDLNSQLQVWPLDSAVSVPLMQVCCACRPWVQTRLLRMAAWLPVLPSGSMHCLVK